MKYSNTTNNPLVAEGQRLWKETLYRRDYSRAFALFSEAAAQGDADGINMVGMSYFHGRGVDKDTHKSAVHFLKAARLGHPQAQYNLGVLLCGEGKACFQGLGRSVHWFRKAADQGYMPAFWEMGNAYREGLGVEKDFTEAAAWFNRGVQAGDSSCMTFLGLMHFRGEGMAEDEQAAVKLWQEAAEIITNYLEGGKLRASGIPVDIRKASLALLNIFDSNVCRRQSLLDLRGGRPIFQFEGEYIGDLITDRNSTVSRDRDAASLNSAGSLNHPVINDSIVGSLRFHFRQNVRRHDGSATRFPTPLGYKLPHRLSRVRVQIRHRFIQNENFGMWQHCTHKLHLLAIS